MSIPRALNFCEIKFTPATFFGLQAPRLKAYPIYIFARTRAACAQGSIKRRHSRVKKASRTGGRKDDTVKNLLHAPYRLMPHRFINFCTMSAGMA